MRSRGAPTRDEEHVRKRTAILAPIVGLNERVRARRSRRSAPDVEADPETGEERLVTEDGVTPRPRSGRAHRGLSQRRRQARERRADRSGSTPT